MKLESLIKRDGVNCGLCGFPISTVHKVPHPLAGTTGHIVPRVRGGSHGPHNLRVEHCVCNALKGICLDSELNLITLEPLDIESAHEKMILGGKRSHELNPGLAQRAGSLGGKKLKELYPNLASEAGKKAHQLDPTLARRAGLAGGHKGGSATQKLHPEKMKELLAKGSHTRWHTERGIKKKGCRFCEEAA